MLSKVGRTMDDAKTVLPTFAVAKEYHDSPSRMQHSGEDPFCNAVAGDDMVIFRFNVSRSEILCVKPASGKEFANSVMMRTPLNENGWLIPIYAAENSVIVMGGHFPEQMEAYAVLPDDSDNIEFKGPLGQLALTQHRRAAHDNSAASPRQAWDLYRLAALRDCVCSIWMTKPSETIWHLGFLPRWRQTIHSTTRTHGANQQQTLNVGNPPMSERRPRCLRGA